MKLPTISEAIEIGVDLEILGQKLVRGEIPDSRDVLRLLAASVVAFTDDVEELKPYLTDASRARQNFLLDIAAKAQLGERPK